jgi:hypothetical protein
MLGYVELAPLAPSRRWSIQALGGRHVHMPYDAEFTVDGWTYVPPDPKSPPTFSPTPLPGYVRYRAADHMAVTDDRHYGTIASWSTPGVRRRAKITAGWLRTRGVTSPGGGRESGVVPHRARFGDYLSYDQFHILWGDYPLYRERDSDTYIARGDAERTFRTGAMKGGVGMTYDEVSSREIEWQQLGYSIGGQLPESALDTVRTYHAFVPGGFGYVQGRWLSGGLIVEGGLRAEYFTAGPQSDDQSLPGGAGGTWSLSPRLGVTIPTSERDAISLAYARMQQNPPLDHLFDSRRAITIRQPLGNPRLQPSTVIAYEITHKHQFLKPLAMMTSVFVRDVFGQIGARAVRNAEGLVNLTYVDGDEGHATGFEWSLVHTGEQRRVEARYTWMLAWGSESSSEGDPYGALRSDRIDLLSDRPLSWDRRHSFSLSGSQRWTRVTLSWSTTVGSGMPWTPRTLGEVQTDPDAVNSRRFRWSEKTDASLRWSPARARGFYVGLDARNLFDHRGARLASVDGYPNPTINTLFDDYGAFRSETGLGGGAYWSSGIPGQENHWVRVHDPRLDEPPRALRASVGARW